MRYSFSGHETFTCRSYWPKKGLDHIWNGGKFDNESMRSLGVGKNMVSSIKYWIKSFGLTDQIGESSQLANFLFLDGAGKDPYLEDIGSVWLLHYLLVTSEIASIYNLVFNYFRKSRLEFTRITLQLYLENLCKEKDFKFSSNSIKKDIGVFINSYLLPEKSMSIESDFFGLLYELELIERVRKEGKDIFYKIENKSRISLSPHILLACILLTEKRTITFNELCNAPNSIGSVFALNSSFLMNAIELMCEKYSDEIVYTDDAGVRVVQISDSLNFTTVLNDYYGQ